MTALRPPSGDPPWTVRAPASTSNLGPGFDLVGLALDLGVEVTLEEELAAGRIVIAREATGPGGSDEAGWPDEDDLVAVGLRRAAPGRGARLTVRSDVPVARGLGSSAAATVAGLALGYALTGRPLERRALVAEAASIEGHPDNAAPSVLGGLVLAVPHERGPALVREPLHPSLGYALAWPDRPLATRVARAALPTTIERSLAVHTAGRLALLLRGLASGDPELLRLGGEDRLHVPHRLPLIPGAERALERAREAGAFLATLSGSGSALFAIGPKTPQGALEAIAYAMADAFEQETGTGHARVARVDEEGVRFLAHPAGPA